MVAKKKAIRGGTGDYAKLRRKIMMEMTGGDTRKIYHGRGAKGQGTAQHNSTAHTRNRRRHSTKMR